VQIANPKLFGLRKQQFNEVVEPLSIHVRKLGKKKTSPSNHAIIGFLGATNPYQKNDEQQ
jgi:hypothetical protein